MIKYSFPLVACRVVLHTDHESLEQETKSKQNQTTPVKGTQRASSLKCALHKLGAILICAVVTVPQHWLGEVKLPLECGGHYHAGTQTHSISMAEPLV